MSDERVGIISGHGALMPESVAREALFALESQGYTVARLERVPVWQSPREPMYRPAPASPAAPAEPPQPGCHARVGCDEVAVDGSGFCRKHYDAFDPASAPTTAEGES